jgi:dTDP-glucose 4,6-dehydratase
VLLVTGAAGFIGSNLVRYLLRQGTDIEILALDALTYSGHRESLGAALTDDRVEFVHGDIRNADLIRSLFSERDIEGVIHLAAESHVDRSIDSPMDFVTTNIQGTATLLAEADRHWKQHPNRRFHHVSTDEVFGTLGTTGYFSESSPYSPRSPYAASKAASDHLVRAWGETYGLNVVITNCTNNYGPYQFPEKLIPVTIDRLSHQSPIPVYGDGSNVRDWLYVADHCEALFEVYRRGTAGETYCIGGRSEVTNLDLVNRICDIYDDLTERSAGTSRNLIEFVTDRPGHDFRYAMDISKISSKLGWAPSVDQDEGLRKTVKWYLENQGWVEAVRNDDHDQFQERWYK